MFPRLNLCARDNIEANKNLFVEHLNGLLLQFSNYFGDLDFTKFAWIQNPFIDEEDDEFGLTSIEKEKLIELSCDTTLKHKFQTVSLVQFWLNLHTEYNTLSNKALKVLLLLATSYLCKTGFSALAAMKSKYRARLVVEKELRVAISSQTPRFDQLCANRQAHPSH
ncbi:protein FAM200A-like [Parasteatoda tepidariorum]|uniref:protein FAM200A-like n=1 Tax=Parasteatoda tepidariorum TaxID=114398 RepID=UPI001C722628|nr:protein FAM200A-like [Parasteatoda tepidariorum]